MLLGDFGAEVVKIEHPSIPDPARGHGPSKDGIGLWFKTLARNKRLITLGLSDPEGRAVFLRLVERADVVIENFRPGTRAVAARARGAARRRTRGSDRARERLRADRAYAGRPGFGTLAEAMSGFAALNSEPDGPPLLPRLALADGERRSRLRSPPSRRSRPERRRAAARWSTSRSSSR